MAVRFTKPTSVADLIQKHFGIVFITKAEDPNSESGFLSYEGEMYDSLVEETRVDREDLKNGVVDLVGSSLSLAVVANGFNLLTRQYLDAIKPKVDIITVEHAQGIGVDSHTDWGSVYTPRTMAQDDLDYLIGLAQTQTLFYDPALDSMMNARANNIIVDVLANVAESDAPEVLATRLAGMVDKTESYWATYSTSVLNQARSYGSLVYFQEEGFEFFRYSNPGDARTTPFCASINGLEISVQTGLNHMRSVAEMSDIDLVRDNAPFIFFDGDNQEFYYETSTGRQTFGKDQVGPDLLAEIGALTPPFHFRCRTLLLPV